MGRASNRKWRNRRSRVWSFLKSDLPARKAEGLRQLARFIRKPPFFKYFTVARAVPS